MLSVNVFVHVNPPKVSHLLRNICIHYLYVFFLRNSLLFTFCAREATKEIIALDDIRVYVCARNNLKTTDIYVTWQEHLLRRFRGNHTVVTFDLDFYHGSYFLYFYW